MWRAYYELQAAAHKLVYVEDRGISEDERKRIEALLDKGRPEFFYLRNAVRVCCRFRLISLPSPSSFRFPRTCALPAYSSPCRHAHKCTIIFLPPFSHRLLRSLHPYIRPGLPTARPPPCLPVYLSMRSFYPTLVHSQSLPYMH